MKAVPLTQGYEAIVDDDVADLIDMLGWSWFARVDSRTGTVYAGRLQPQPNKPKAVLHLHRWIVSAPTALLVDHRDGNGLHNWNANLRLATQTQNHGNSVSANSVCGFRGVTPHRNGFQAQIRKDGRYHYLGVYPTPEEAHVVYRARHRELFGEFSPDICR